MTDEQIAYVWERARYYGDDVEDLSAAFPDVDWAAVHAAERARWKAEAAARTPSEAAHALKYAEITSALAVALAPQLVRCSEQMNAFYRTLSRSDREPDHGEQ